MTAWKCTECHHEWIGARERCAWCNAAGKTLAISKPAPILQLAELMALKPGDKTAH